jgi:hypothetical protein
MYFDFNATSFLPALLICNSNRSLFVVIYHTFTKLAHDTVFSHSVTHPRSRTRRPRSVCPFSKNSSTIKFPSSSIERRHLLLVFTTTALSLMNNSFCFFSDPLHMSNICTNMVAHLPVRSIPPRTHNKPRSLLI